MPEGQKYRLLAVDDERQNAAIVARIAVRQGFESETAFTVGEARDKITAALAEGRPFDVVVTDWDVDEKSVDEQGRDISSRRFGSEVVEAARAAGAKRVIVYTAGDTQRKEILATNPDLVVQKPFAMATMQEAIRLDEAPAAAVTPPDEIASTELAPEDAPVDGEARVTPVEEN